LPDDRAVECLSSPGRGFGLIDRCSTCSEKLRVFLGLGLLTSRRAGAKGLPDFKARDLEAELLGELSGDGPQFCSRIASAGILAVPVAAVLGTLPVSVACCTKFLSKFALSDSWGTFWNTVQASKSFFGES